VAAADTNVIVRLLTADDAAEFRHADAFVKSNKSVFVSNVVLAETVWVLTSAYRYTKKQIVSALEGLLEVPDIELEDDGVVSEALDDYRASTADFSDCLVLAIARARGRTPLATFDRRLARLQSARRLGKIR
jgi:predicted nucleic-acid-binding protein